MRLPNQRSLWAQRTSEKMKLGTGKQGGGGMDGGRERDTTVNIKSVKSDGTDREHEVVVFFFLQEEAWPEEQEKPNKVLGRRTERLGGSPSVVGRLRRALMYN